MGVEGRKLKNPRLCKPPYEYAAANNTRDTEQSIQIGLCMDTNRKTELNMKSNRGKKEREKKRK
jgi:hypothetical protein